MKFNWGTGITIFIGFFLLSMAFFIFKSYQEDYPLVEKEYYPKGLEYDKQLARIRNTEALAEKFSVEQTGSEVVVRQPAVLQKGYEGGNIHFYRPSAESGDLKDTIRVDSTLKQSFPLAKLMEGKYLVKINWKMGGKEYYQEEPVYIRH
jgi:nitrogen fixation protein FixH